MALAGLFKKDKPLSAEQKQQIAQALYLGVDPFVDKAYKTDPRTGVANNLIEQGSNVGPAAGGYTEGIARALSGLAGGYVAKQQRDKYGIADAEQSGLFNASLKQPVADALTAATPTGVNPATAAMAAPPPDMGAGTGQVNLGGAAPPPAMPPPNPQAQVAAALAPQQGAVPPAALTPNPPPPPQGGSLMATQPAAASSVNYSNAAPRVLTPGEPAGLRQRAAAANTGFRSYQSGAYDPIEAQVEQKHGLPPGTLRGLRMAERSNADQVSPTGARTVYQFVRGTRRRILDKFGVDAYAGPAQAAEAAALHIKDSLNRGKDMEGALRDYRGVDESKDPGWYSRARGGAMPGGSAASAPSEAQIPPMPEAPVAPERPKLGDRVRSARLQIVQNMLNADGDRYNATQIRAALTPFLDKGLDEEQTSKEKQYDAENQLTNNEYTSKLQLYNQEAGALYKQPLEERTAAITQRDKLEQDRIGHGYDLERDRLNNEADLRQENARIAATTGGGKALPAKLEKDINDGSSMLDTQRRLVTGFQDDYSGYGLNIFGEGANVAANAASSIGFGSEKSEARIQWWKDYQAWSNEVRHGQFGSALTPQEKQQWDKANFDMGTSPSIIKKNLEVRSGIAARALERRTRSAAAAGYNQDQIRELVGDENLAFMQEGASRKTPDEQTAASQTQSAKTVAGATSRQNRAPGTPRSPKNYVTKDNSQYYQDAQGNWYAR